MGGNERKELLFNWPVGKASTKTRVLAIVVPDSHYLPAVVDIGARYNCQSDPAGMRLLRSRTLWPSQRTATLPSNTSAIVGGDTDNLAGVVDAEWGAAHRKRWGVQVDPRPEGATTVSWFIADEDITIFMVIVHSSGRKLGSAFEVWKSGAVSYCGKVTLAGSWCFGEDQSLRIKWGLTPKK